MYTAGVAALGRLGLEGFGHRRTSVDRGALNGTSWPGEVSRRSQIVWRRVIGGPNTLRPTDSPAFLSFCRPPSTTSRALQLPSTAKTHDAFLRTLPLRPDDVRLLDLQEARFVTDDPCGFDAGNSFSVDVPSLDTVAYDE